MRLPAVAEFRGDHAHPAVVEDVVTGLRFPHHVVGRFHERVVGADDAIPPERHQPGHVAATALGGGPRSDDQHAGAVEIGRRKVHGPRENFPAVLGLAAAARFAEREGRGGLLNRRGHPLVEVAAHVGPRHEFLGHDLRRLAQESSGKRGPALVVAPVNVVECHERQVRAREIPVGPDSLPGGRWHEHGAVVAEERPILRPAVIPHRDLVQRQAFACRPCLRQRSPRPIAHSAGLGEMIGVEQGSLVDHEVILGADRAGETLEACAVASGGHVRIAKEHAEVPH